MPTASRPLVLGLAAALALGCGTTTVPSDDLRLAALEVTAVSPSVVLPGTSLTVTGSGFLAPELGHHVLRLEGAGVTLDLPAVRKDDTTLTYAVDDTLLGALPAGAAFDGTLTVLRTLDETGQVDAASLPITLEAAENLTPTVTGFSSDGDLLYPGDEVTVTGTGFLLPGEGHTVLQLTGTFQTKVPPETRTVQAVVPITAETRESIRLLLTPDVLGIRPGIFKGDLAVSNEAKAGRVDGTGLSGLTRELKAPYIEAITPAAAARGQRIEIHGRGFLPTDPFYEATTLIRLEGAFTASKTSAELTLDGPTALALFPDAFQGNEVMDYILRVSISPAGELGGLGLLAGTFQGVVSPMILSGAETILGSGKPVTLTIAPMRQIVFVSFLPGFSETVSEMGLAPVESAVKDRILAVCARDYKDVNIEFRATRPTDFAEYSVIEVGGADPNQAGLFGLDNTAGKDVGNLRFNDVIGGSNAETQEQGYHAFGGVFVKSFFQISPTLNKQEMPIKSQRFDDIFGPFMPALGGAAVTDADFGGARQADVDEAVRVLGNLVGTTVTHEIGHSLGLAALEGEYHNVGDNPGWIMDSGNNRPFAERAELDGQGPGIWGPVDQVYLQRVLPVQ